MRRAVALMFVAGLTLPAQDLLPSEVLMLSRIRARVREVVDRLPDCACIESVARFRKARGKELQPVDKLVFQVLFSGGKELFALPGGTRWETEPFPFMTSGLMSNGIFALHLRSIFLNDQSLIRYHGMEQPSGRAEARYDYSMSSMMSGFNLTRGRVTAAVAQRGSFWADPETYDLRRLEFYAEEMPPELLYSEVYTSIWYERVRLGDADVLLPQSAELRTVDTNGEEDRNLIEFTQCQRFHVESELRFSGPVSDSGLPSHTAPPAPAREVALPPNLRLTLALSAPLDDRMPVGLPIEAKVAGDVTLKRKLLVPGGSLVRGRIRQLEQSAEYPGHFIVALEFTDIEAPGSNFRFYADLVDLDRPPGVQTALELPGLSGARIQVLPRAVSGVATFFVSGPHFPPGPRIQTDLEDASLATGGRPLEATGQGLRAVLIAPVRLPGRPRAARSSRFRCG
jgi:hypothetical protein